MVTLQYNGKSIRIRNVVDAANKILSDQDFYNQIRAVEKFDQTILSGSNIASLMEQANHSITITGAFKPIANASTQTSDEIKVSTIWFGRNLIASVNTLVHETVHAVDLINGETDFTHESNDNSDGKQDKTAPWVIGQIGEDLYRKKYL